MDTFSLGGVIQRTWRILRLHPLGILILAIVVVAVPSWLGPLLVAPFFADLQIAPRSGQPVGAATFVVGFLLGVAPEIVKYLGNLVLTAMVAVAAWRDAQGEPSDLGASLRGGLRVFLPLLLISILSGIAIMLGSLLLIVPGAILALMWFVVNQTYAVERPGIAAAYGRSRFLTSGYRWRLLGIALLFGLAVLVVFAVAVFAVYLAVRNGVPGGFIALSILTSIGTALLYLVTAAGLAAIYIELRRAKEGFLSRDLVDAFT